MNEALALPHVLREDRTNAVAILTVCNPPVNALSQGLRIALLERVLALSKEDAVCGIVITGENGSFIAGADIREMAGPLLDPSLPELLDVIENSRKPVIAAIGKVALGGGAELALACHARVAARGTSIGFPEVKLGIIPGAGGVPRLLRLIDAQAALDLVASGRTIDSDRAKELGLIDEVVDKSDLLAVAINRAREAADRGFVPTSARSIPPYDQEGLTESFTRWQARARGQDSVTEAIQAVRRTLEVDYPEAIAVSRDIFLNLRNSGQARALRHLFFAEREAQKIPGISSELAKSIKSVAVIGAGTMGRGIATACIRAGYTTLLVDQAVEVVTTARLAISESLARLARSEGLDQTYVAKTLERLSVDATFNNLGNHDLVIEAVFEDMQVKHNVIAEIAKTCHRNAIIATNTSYLDTNSLARASLSSARFVGIHFFSPAEIMRLVEIIRGDETDAPTLATAIRFARSLGKVPVVAGVCDGFIVNRVLAAYRLQMEYLLEDGALPHQIDEAMEAFGMAMGPFAVADLSGLDIGWARRKRLAPTRDPSQRYVKIADHLCEMGRFGRKTGAGWYDYSKGTREPDPVVERLVLAASEERGILRRYISAYEIVERATNSMVDEASKLLREGIALRASDVDLAIAYGLGFPQWRGGPLYHHKRTNVEEHHQTA